MTRLAAYDGTTSIIWPRSAVLRVLGWTRPTADWQRLQERLDREWAASEGELPVTPAEIGWMESMEGRDDDDYRADGV